MPSSHPSHALSDSFFLSLVPVRVAVRENKRERLRRETVLSRHRGEREGEAARLEAALARAAEGRPGSETASTLPFLKSLV